MKINEFIIKYRKVDKFGIDFTRTYIPHVICKDGFEMSVQAGQSLYSEPRDVQIVMKKLKSVFRLQKNHCLHPTRKITKIFVILSMDMSHVQLLTK